jgi:hypothetical protein
MKKLTPILAVAVLCGCANISHKRIVSTAADGTKTVDEKETAHFFFQKEAAQKVNSSTHDSGTNYTHSFSAVGVQVTGDVELVNAIGKAVASGIAAGAQGAGKAVVP